MSDIVEDLRKVASMGLLQPEWARRTLYWKASDEIERLIAIITAKDAEIAALRADVEEQIRLRDHFGSRLVSLEDEKNAYIDHVGDALGQSDDESLWDAAQRVLSDRDRCRVIVDRLIERKKAIDERMAEEREQ